MSNFIHIFVAKYIHMCTNPRKITNPTRFFYEGRTKRVLTVPCGQCEECRAQKAQDWHLRSWSEVKKYIESKYVDAIGRVYTGKVVFVTFTYKDCCLPKFRWTDDVDGTIHEIPCFSKKDKNRFLNTMRKSQERLGYTGKDELPLRYIWACEYGKKVGSTHRPHYHAMLFFPPKLVSLLGFSSENQWKKYIQGFWPYGWCRWSKPQSKGGKGIFVTDEFAGEYVSKYITKDLDFYEQPELSQFIYDKDHKLLKENVVQLKDKLPTHWQSLQFGAELCKIYNNAESLKNGVDFNFTGDIKKGRRKLSRVPRYIRRKLLYKDVGNTENRRYVLNDFGVQVTVDEFVSNLDSYVSSRSDFFNENVLRLHLSDDDIRQIFRDDSMHFQSVLELSTYLTDLLGHRTLAELYMYDMVWAGLYDRPDRFYDLDGLSYDDFIRDSIEQYVQIQNKHFTNFDAYVEEGIFHDGNDFAHDLKFYDSCRRFDEFDIIIKYIHMCDGFIRARTHREYLRQRAEKLAMNHELCDFERRFGPAFHSPGLDIDPQVAQRGKSILARIRAKGINY